MGKVRVQRRREDSDDDEPVERRVNRSGGLASTSLFNVFRSNSSNGNNSALKSGSGSRAAAAAVGGKKRARRSGFTTNQLPSANDGAPSKRARVDSKSVTASGSGDGTGGHAFGSSSTPLLSYLGTAGSSRVAESGLSSWSPTDSDGDSESRRQPVAHTQKQRRQSNSDRDSGSDSWVDEEDSAQEGSCSDATQILRPVRDSSGKTDRTGQAERRAAACPDRSRTDEEDLGQRLKGLLRTGFERDQELQDEASDDDEEDIVSRSSGNNSSNGSGTYRQMHLDSVGARGDRSPSGVRLFLHRGSALVALSDFAAISLAGSAWLQVACGSVRVFGVRLCPSDGPVHVQSVPASCVLIGNAGPTDSTEQRQRLHERMQLMGAGLAFEKARELISRFPRKTIIVLHGLSGSDRYSSLKPNFRTASDSTPENMWSDCRFYLSPIENWVPDNNSRRLDDLTTNVLKAAGRTSVRLAVVGSKNSGKSTTIRVLCNRILHSVNRTSVREQRGDANLTQRSVPIFVLDLDPGQTEFTPAACVSLVEVNRLLMGPPAAHQMKPHKSLLLGDSTPGARPEAYVAAVNALVAYVNNELTFNHILIVNTMGWLAGIGELLLGTVLDVVKPCKVLASSSDFELPRSAWPAKDVQIDVPIVKLKPLDGLFTPDPFTKPVTAAEHRKSTIISYFGGVGLLNRKTIAVPWNSVALHEVSGLCPPQELLRLMNANVVALCCAAEDTIWKSKSDPTLPMLLRELAGVGYEPLECVGFAFVRAVDMLRKTIHLITPEAEETVRSANALVHCTGLNLTEYLVSKQSRGSRQGLAPYTTTDRALIRPIHAL